MNLIFTFNVQKAFTLFSEFLRYKKIEIIYQEIVYQEVGNDTEIFLFPLS